MPTVPVSNEQLEVVKAKVQKLVDDQADAVTKTASGNAAKTAMMAAQQASADADIAEANADALVSADLQDLLSYLGTITGTTITATPTT